jgi:hypothetical protein
MTEAAEIGPVEYLIVAFLEAGSVARSRPFSPTWWKAGTIRIIGISVREQG